jgi:RHS repeat-associated protein
MVPVQSIEGLFEPVEIKGRAAAGSVDTALAYTLVNGPRTDVGDSTLFWLDRFGAPRRIRDALGNVTELSRTDGIWPAAVTRIQYPNGRAVRGTYNTLGLVSSVTDSSFCQGGQCATTTYSYDTRWGFVSVIVPPMRDTLFFGYDTTNGNRIWQQDARGSSTRATFRYGNTLALLSSIEVPGSVRRDSFEYDTRGNPSRRLTVDGGNLGVYHTTTIGNDSLGYPSRVASTDGVVDSTYRDHRRGLDSLRVRRGPVRTDTLPGWGTGGSPLIVNWAEQVTNLMLVYDPEGNLIETRRWWAPTQPQGMSTLVEQMRYDRANRMQARVAPDGQRDSTVYDPAGNAIRLNTRRGHWIDQSFDAGGRLTERRLPAATYPDRAFGGVLFYAFTIPADTVRFFYDAMGRDTLGMNAVARVRRSYQPNGLLSSETQNLRSALELQRSVSDNTGFTQHVYTLAYSYDLNGRRTALGHPTQLGYQSDQTSFTYHPFGALATIADPYGRTFRFVYDAEARLDSLIYPNNTWEKWTYAYDGGLRYRYALSGNTTACPTVAESRSCFPDNVIRADSMYYTRDGLIFRVFSAGRERQEYTYTGNGQVGYSERGYYSTRHNPSTYWITSGEWLRPDALGNMLSADHRVPNNRIENDFWYNTATGRLTQESTYLAATGDSWTAPTEHDSSGNVQFSARGRTGTQCVSGDALVCSQSEARGWWDVARYMYDAEQRLRWTRRSVSISPDREQVGGTEQYLYDPYGRRVMRKWTTNLYWDYAITAWRADSTFDRYVWDGTQILYEIRAPGRDGYVDSDFMSMQEFGRVGYVHGPGIDRPLKVFRADTLYYPEWGREIYLHADWRGAITLGSLPDGSKDRASQNWPSMIDWDSRNQMTFGQQSVAFNNTNYRYWGSLLSQQVDGSKLQYLRNRYYDPATGRFTQEDPIGLAGGLNLYGFAGGDPVNFSDPFGLCVPWPECGSGALASPGLFDPVMLLAGGMAGGIRSLFARAVTRAAVTDATATATAGIPTASNPALQRTISALFRAGDRIPGGTAGAIRLEATTGRAVGGRFHFQKGIERIRNLENILGREELPGADRALAERLLSDLRSAVRFAQDMAQRAAQ